METIHKITDTRAGIPTPGQHTNLHKVDWIQNQLPGGNYNLGWFEDSFQPVMAQEYRNDLHESDKGEKKFQQENPYKTMPFN